MKILSLITAFTVAATACAHAQVFDITFTGSQSAATGQIDVVSGLAASGSITVTSGANQGTYNLVSLTSPLINGAAQGNAQTLVLTGGDQIFDDVVTPGSNPFVTSDGLEFANDDSKGFNLFSNGSNSYTLFDTGPGVYVIDNGAATLTATPEPSSWGLGLCAFGFLGLLGAVRARSIRN